MSQYLQPNPDKTFYKLWHNHHHDYIIALNQFQDPPNPKLYTALIRNIISIQKIVEKNALAMSKDPLPNIN